jgi:hypothetical protein
VRIFPTGCCALLVAGVAGVLALPGLAGVNVNDAIDVSVSLTNQGDGSYLLNIANEFDSTSIISYTFAPVSGFKIEAGAQIGGASAICQLKSPVVFCNLRTGLAPNGIPPGGSATLNIDHSSGTPGAANASGGTVIVTDSTGNTQTFPAVNKLAPGVATATTTTTAKSPTTTLNANDVRDVNTAIDDEQDALRALGSDFVGESAALRALKFAEDELKTVAKKIDLFNNIVRIDLDRDLNMALTNDSDATASIERLTAIRAKTPDDYSRIEAERDFAEKAIKEALVNKEAALSELDTLIKK